jgi:hypothetical protein
MTLRMAVPRYSVFHVFRRGAAFFVVLAVIVVAACAEGGRIEVPPGTGDAGPPDGFDDCRERYFGTYLKTCKDSKDCTGVLECDVTKKFSTTPRCHVRLCEREEECEAAFKTLCTGDDFHFACSRVSPLVPKECRVVQGAKP